MRTYSIATKKEQGSPAGAPIVQNRLSVDFPTQPENLSLQNHLQTRDRSAPPARVTRTWSTCAVEGEPEPA